MSRFPFAEASTVCVNEWAVRASGVPKWRAYRRAVADTDAVLRFVDHDLIGFPEPVFEQRDDEDKQSYAQKDFHYTLLDDSRKGVDEYGRLASRIPVL